MAALAGGALGLKNPNDMFVGMLKSRTVEDAMVQQFGLMQLKNLRRSNGPWQCENWPCAEYVWPPAKR